jgi:hypothetical protein
VLIYVVIIHTHTYTLLIPEFMTLAGGGYYFLYKHSIDTRMVTKKNRHNTSDFVVANVNFYYKSGHRD